jgi:hypothetical protein
LQAGQVVGASDSTASAPEGEGIAPEDVAATFYGALGIDHQKEYQSSTGRPLMIVRDGKILPALLG